MDPSVDLSVTTTVTEGYVGFLEEWADSIAQQTRRPAHVVIVGNGINKRDRGRCRAALARCGTAGTFVDQAYCGVGHAMNVAIDKAPTPWAMMLGADDVLFPDGLEQVGRIISPGAVEVVQLGYEPWISGTRGWPVLYLPLTGLAALDAARIASGPSPFLKALWHEWPFPEALPASWDYGLWLGFAHLGARFRPTSRPAFRYRLRHDGHYETVGRHRHDDLLSLRRALEQYGVKDYLRRTQAAS